MSKKEATRLLDSRREGEEIPDWLVDEALAATGDLEPPLMMAYTNVEKTCETK